MRFLSILSVLTVAACGDSFKADGLELPVDTLVASFVETGSVSFDSDDDGENDLTQRGVGVVLTDREDLCSSGAAIEDIDDIFAIQLIALDVNGPDPLRTNTSLFGAVLGPQDGDVFIGVRVIERVGGETVAQYATRNLVDPEFIDDGEFWVSGRSVRDGTTTRLSGTFEAVLGADLSNPDAFDTDGSSDGVNDHESIDISVKGRISNAQDCSTLNILP